MHECVLCGCVYDEDAEDAALAELDDNHRCPFCSAGKEAFRQVS
jgi:rubredoxin